MAKKSIKDRIKEAQARTRAAISKGGSLLGKAKPLAVAGAAGAVADWGVDKLAENVSFVRDNWYGRPAAMFLGALFVAKKSQHAALGIAGAAGAMARRNYGAPYGTQTTNVLGAPKTGAQALQDGSEVLYGDTSALQDVVG